MMTVFFTKISKPFDAELADLFLKNGHKVVATGLTKPKNPAIIYVACNPEVPESVDAAMVGIKTRVQHVNYFIDTTDEVLPEDNFSVLDGLNPEVVAKSYRINFSQPIRILEAVLPMMEDQEVKRICFMNSPAGSINWNETTTGYGHNMAKAALSQSLMITKNRILPLGYTFRLFDPMQDRGVDPKVAAAGAFVYFTRDRYLDSQNPGRADENNIVLRNAFGREIPW